MAGRDAGDDGGLSDLPWASVFDPSINVRALGEIQARGFRAASDLVDRFVRATSQPAEERPDDSAQANGDTTAGPRTRPDVDQLLGGWRSMVGQLIGSVRTASVGSEQPVLATFDLANDRADGEITLAAAEPGAVSTEFWVHNLGGTDLGKFRLRCSDLTAHDGTVVPSELMRFEPDAVPMPARSSRGVTIELDVPDGLPPGLYHGTLMADGHPEVWLPVLLKVASRIP